MIETENKIWYNQGEEKAINICVLPDQEDLGSDSEVDLLFERYVKNDIHPKRVTRDELRNWYDGYYTSGDVRLYNPRSIVLALTNNNLGNYWTLN